MSNNDLPFPEVSSSDVPFPEAHSQTNTQPSSGPISDSFFSSTSLGRIMSSFGQSAADGWGARPIGLGPEGDAQLTKMGWFNDYQNNKTSLIKSFNEAFIRPGAAALDAAIRTGSAGLSGVQGALSQSATELKNDSNSTGPHLLPGPLNKLEGAPAELLGDLSSGALPEGEVHTPITESTLSTARAKGVIGEGEKGFFNTEPPSPENLQARQEATEESGNPEVVTASKSTPPVRDVNVLARQVSPDVFQEYDAKTVFHEELTKRLNRPLETPSISISEDKAQPWNGKEFDFPIEGGGNIWGNLLQDGKTYQVKLSTQDEGLRGQGLGTMAYSQLADQVVGNNGVLQSDKEVSFAAARVYEKLKEQGYGVEKNSNITEDEKGITGSKTDDKPSWVYRITSIPEEKPSFIFNKDPIQLATEEAFKENLSRLQELEPQITDAYRHASDLLLDSKVQEKPPEKPVQGDLSSGTPSTNQPPETSVETPQAISDEPVTGSTTNRLTPIEGTGEKNAFGLSQTILDKALDSGLIDERERFDLPGAKSTTWEHQATRAGELVENDYELAKQIAMGQKEAPKDVLPEAVLIGVTQRAIREGDIGLVRQLGTQSGLLRESRTMGQRIGILSQLTKDDPVSAIREVQDAREKDAMRRKVDVEGTKNQLSKELKNTINSEANKDPRVFQNFLKEIECDY